MSVELGKFKLEPFSFGRGIVVRTIWHLFNVLVLRNPFVVFSSLRIVALKLFGAKLGRGLLMQKPISVKCPWHLQVGDYSWIGEGVWIDNLTTVKIASNVCISQGAYLCTGNHNWSKRDFPMRVEGIEIMEGVWVGARANIGPGSVLEKDSIISLGTTFTGRAKESTIYYYSQENLITKSRKFL